VLDRVAVHVHVANTVRLMLDKGLASLLGNLFREFELLADAEAGRVRAHVTTATQLSAELVAEVKATLETSTGKIVFVESSVDPELIGGMVVKVGSIVYDASVRSRLEQLRQQRRMSILLITHDLGVVAQSAQRVAVMYASKIVEFADVETLFAEPSEAETSIRRPNSPPRMDIRLSSTLQPCSWSSSVTSATIPGRSLPRAFRTKNLRLVSEWLLMNKIERRKEFAFYICLLA